MAERAAPLLAPSEEATHHENCPGCKQDQRNQFHRGIPYREFFYVWIVALCSGMFADATDTILPKFHQYKVKSKEGSVIRDLDIAKREEDIGFYAGFVGSAFMLGRALTSILWGMVADRYGRKPVIVISLLAVIVFNTLFGLSTRYWMAIMTRTFLGFLSGLLGPIQAYASEVCRKEYQALGLSVVDTSWAMGLIFGPAIGGFLAQPAEKYPNIFSAECLFGRFPYFLPCLCISLFSVGALIACFWLPIFSLWSVSNKKYGGLSFSSQEVGMSTITVGLNILQNNAVSHHQRGAANGMAVTALSLFKAFAPAGFHGHKTIKVFPFYQSDNWFRSETICVDSFVNRRWSRQQKPGFAPCCHSLRLNSSLLLAQKLKRREEKRRREEGERSRMGNVETMRTSSSRREMRSENRPNTIGCMSGIFHLLSRHHNRSRKRLTSANRKEKPAVAPPSRPKLPPPRPIDDEEGKKTEPQRRSCETPRSPTIPQEIRRRPAVAVAAASPDSPRRPSALVARLMGLEDSPAPPVAAAADKRRELLRALEKCDEDLQALKRIIEAVRSAEIKAKVVPSAGGPAGRLEWDGGDPKNQCNGEQPSPVSVLDAVSSPRNRSNGSPNEKQEITTAGLRMAKPPARLGALFVGEERCNAAQLCAFYGRISMEAMPRVVEPKGRAIVEDLGPAKLTESVRQQWRGRRRRRSASRAMGETVEEVWEDGVWEQRWEAGRVGVWVEADIMWDLVEELVVELFGWCLKLSPPPGTCRKRLCF
ncbi:major facilitator superfamily antiporter [Musa troglodytarum]|uniref:Major facilitator superfamily antiporter n=1 Tax=Musa troglodytarum TaxID=320322 RepID=A0A9E7G5P9_9LILI|nr:major facilitator superfamily antiporter [Musa troglodytarum]